MDPALPSFVIVPEGWYSDDDIVLMTQIPQAALDRAHRAGELRFAKKGPHRWHLGSWVLEWLKADAEPQGAVHARY
jgi:hypothetical protein